MFTNPLRTVVTEPLLQAGHTCAYISPCPCPHCGRGSRQSLAGPSLCSWAQGPRGVLSQPCPRVEPTTASCPMQGALSLGPWPALSSTFASYQDTS